MGLRFRSVSILEPVADSVNWGWGHHDDFWQYCRFRVLMKVVLGVLGLGVLTAFLRKRESVFVGRAMMCMVIVGSVTAASWSLASKQVRSIEERCHGV